MAGQPAQKTPINPSRYGVPQKSKTPAAAAPPPAFTTFVPGSAAEQPRNPAEEIAYQRMLASRPAAVVGGVAGTGAGIGVLGAQADANTQARLAGREETTRLGAEDYLADLNKPRKTAQEAAKSARDAIGPAPTIDMGLADRGVGKLDESIAANQSVLEQALAGPDLTGARAVLDQLLNGPSTAERLGQQTLKTQLALARSAAGGPGAVSDALMNAQAQAPELQAQATQQAVTEMDQRRAAAGDIATSIGNIQNTATSTAGQVAGQITNAELGKRQQDIGIAQANQGAAVTVLQEVARLTGTELELDQRNQELIGQMARDMAAQSFNWASLGVQAQQAYFAQMIQMYGIDKNFEAQIEAIAANKSIGPLDVFNGIVGVVGAAAGVGAAAIKGG